MKEILSTLSAGSVFYNAGMSYHNCSVLKRGSGRKAETVGIVFMFDNLAGFDNILNKYSNVKRLNTGKTYAPEISKPSLLVMTKAEIKRQK